MFHPNLFKTEREKENCIIKHVCFTKNFSTQNLSINLKIRHMKFFRFFTLSFLVFFASSCAKDLPFDSPEKVSDDENSLLLKSGKEIKIAIVTDIHYLDPSLMQNNAASGTAFQAYLAQDPKLIEFSDPLFRTILSQLSRERPDVLLIPGDLTKDGEKVSHQTVSSLLQQFAGHRTKVFIVPGNHDINNPYSAGYNGDDTYPVPTVTPQEFSLIYEQFGFKNALYRDHYSLSYICQPTKGLWVLGIDACKYNENYVSPEVSGVIKPETMAWIEERMAEAKTKNIKVIALMHHNLMEHYTGQSQLDPGYVVDNWQESMTELLDAGLKVIFTGHYHANDITKYKNGIKAIYDIQTGSPVNIPSPYRLINLEENSIRIKTKYVTDIDVIFPGGMDFVTYSNVFFQLHFDAYFTYFLMMQYALPADAAAFVAPLFRKAVMAHYAGDETISAQEFALIQYVNDNISPDLAMALMSFWTDLQPGDNELRIKINGWDNDNEYQPAENLAEGE
jgi:3',5'-cyclic AMP phosphodiesterase CpdA